MTEFYPVAGSSVASSAVTPWSAAGRPGPRVVLSIASPSRAAGAALGFKAVRAIHGLVTPWLEGDARLAVAAGASGHEHFAPRRGGVAAAGVTGRTEGVGSFRFARRAAGGATARRIIEATTGIELLLTAREN